MACALGGGQDLGAQGGSRAGHVLPDSGLWHPSSPQPVIRGVMRLARGLRAGEEEEPAPGPRPASPREPRASGQARGPARAGLARAAVGADAALSASPGRLSGPLGVARAPVCVRVANGVPGCSWHETPWSWGRRIADGQESVTAGHCPQRQQLPQDGSPGRRQLRMRTRS